MAQYGHRAQFQHPPPQRQYAYEQPYNEREWSGNNTGHKVYRQDNSSNRNFQNDPRGYDGFDQPYSTQRHYQYTEPMHTNQYGNGTELLQNQQYYQEQYDNRQTPVQNYQYDERFRSNGSGRTPRGQEQSSQQVERQRDKRRPPEISKPKPRERILTEPKSPKTLAWDNPFGAFPPKKKDEKEKHSSLDKDTRRRNSDERGQRTSDPRKYDRSRTGTPQEQIQPERKNSDRPQDLQMSPRRDPALSRSSDNVSQPSNHNFDLPVRPPPQRAATGPVGAIIPEKQHAQPPTRYSGDSHPNQSFQSFPAQQTQYSGYNVATYEEPLNPPPPLKLQQQRHPNDSTNARQPQSVKPNDSFNTMGYRGITTGMNKPPSRESNKDMPNFDVIPTETSQYFDNYLASAQEKPAYQKNLYQAQPASRIDVEKSQAAPSEDNYRSPLAEFAFDLPATSPSYDNPPRSPVYNNQSKTQRPRGHRDEAALAQEHHRRQPNHQGQVPYGQDPSSRQYDPRDQNLRERDVARRQQEPSNQVSRGRDSNQNRQPLSSGYPPRSASQPATRIRARNEVDQPRVPQQRGYQHASPERTHATIGPGYGSSVANHDHGYGRKGFEQGYVRSNDQIRSQESNPRYQGAYDQPYNQSYDPIPTRPRTANSSRPQSARQHGGRSSLDNPHPDMPHFGPDSLPAHPTPVRPGLANTTMYSSTPPPQAAQSQRRDIPGSQRPSSGGKEAPVTFQELDNLRDRFRSNPNDHPLGLKLAKKLVEAANVLSSENGTLDPKGTAKNRERYIMEGHKVLKKLVSSNYPEAMFYLADCHSQGQLGLEPDPKEAFLLYQSAAKLGHPQSAYRVAVCCEVGSEEGGGTRRDPMKAMQWYKRAAALSDTPAMYKLGIILLKGLMGQPRNPREGISWLKRAAERANAENPHALHELGLLYESASPTDHIIRDEKYALQLFTQAAELGYKYSQFRLGSAYEYGLLGCAIDSRQSITWYTRAAAQGEHQSELALSGWYLTGAEPLLQQSDSEAYLWARKAAGSGLAKAEYAMGYFTEVGIGTTTNLEEAKRWYYRAASQNFGKARERLEDLKRGGGKMQKTRLSRSNVSRQNEGECVLM